MESIDCVCGLLNHFVTDKSSIDIFDIFCDLVALRKDVVILQKVEKWISALVLDSSLLSLSEL